MVTFIIVRHGYSQFNREKRYTGQLDVPLEDIGVWQAERAAEYVVKHFQIDAIYSSDLSRAMNTAEPVAKALHLPIHREKDLREVYLGSWQGRLIEEVKREEEYRQWSAELCESNDRESTAALLERSKRVIRRIAEENEGKCVLISTHGGVVNALMREWLEARGIDQMKFPANASVSAVNYDVQSGEADILLMGYEGHLYGSFTSEEE